MANLTKRGNYFFILFFYSATSVHRMNLRNAQGTSPSPPGTRFAQVPITTGFRLQSKLTLNVNLEALITSMMLKAAQLMSYPNICNCWERNK